MTTSFRDLSDLIIESDQGEKKETPHDKITRDGFVLLVMGFIGKQAALWKEAYIEAFNRMEEELRKGKVLTPEHRRELQEIEEWRLADYRVESKLDLRLRLWNYLGPRLPGLRYACGPGWRVGKLPDCLFETAKALLETAPLDPPSPTRDVLDREEFRNQLACLSGILEGLDISGLLDKSSWMVRTILLKLKDHEPLAVAIRTLRGMGVDVKGLNAECQTLYCLLEVTHELETAQRRGNEIFERLERRRGPETDPRGGGE